MSASKTTPAGRRATRGAGGLPPRGARPRRSLARGGRRPYHHGDLRRALLDAALALIAKGDVGAVSLREVARQAGVTSAAPYHHFRDKDALLADVAAEGYRALNAALERALARAGPDPLERLRALGRSYLRFAVEHPSHYRVMFRPELGRPDEYPALQAAAGEAFQRLVRLVEQAAHDCPADELVVRTIVAWATVHGFASLWNEGPLKRQPGLPRVATLTSHVAEALARVVAG